MPIVALPTLHPGQVAAYKQRTRFNVIRCGRRWGKTDMAITLSGDACTKGRNVGWFTPDYKIQSEAYRDLHAIIDPVVKSSSKNDGVIHTITSGRVDFWTLENERAGRSQKYHRVIIDEAAFTKDNMMEIWERSIEPTLLDFNGDVWVLSTPNGISEENFFWRVCNDPKMGFTEYYAPTSQNPYMSAAAIEELRQKREPRVFAQEYEAKFVDWSGAAFFSAEKMLVNGQGVPWPDKCDTVYAVIDTALKTGTENDGTAVTYF